VVAPVDPRSVAVTPKPAGRLDRRTESEHLRALMSLPEVGIGLNGQRLLTAWETQIRNQRADTGTVIQTDPTLLFQIKADLRQLPYRMGDRCRISLKAAANLGVLSKKLHGLLDDLCPLGPDGRRTNAAGLGDILHEARRGKKPEWLRVDAVPTLRQLLMAEGADFRRILVRLLAEVPEMPATLVLTEQAVFDLDPDVRAEATQALATRNPDTYRPILVRNLRYPYAPVAEHAAEALAALKRTESVPELVFFLSLPDPTGPQPSSRGTVVQEVVRVKHTANCLLCHPPALTGSEPVIGTDPVVTFTKKTPPKTTVIPGAPITIPSTPSGGYPRTPGTPTTPVETFRPGSPIRTGTGAETVTMPLKIRADITYLRQDFSVSLPGTRDVVLPRPALTVPRPNPTVPAALDTVPSPGPRFDYLIRTRAASPAEKQGLAALEGKDYPQRQAVLFALRELTGRDAGNDTLAWQDLYPRAEDEARAVRPARKVLESNPLQQPLLIRQHRDAQGPINTLILARVVDGLHGPMRDQAETALIARLVRQTPYTRRNALRDEEPSLCQAAIRACVKAGDRQRVPDLAALLESAHPRTAVLAGVALRDLTGESFESPAEWTDWWDRTGKVAQAP
jgi:HEAT repeat protein